MTETCARMIGCVLGLAWNLAAIILLPFSSAGALLLFAGLVIASLASVVAEVAMDRYKKKRHEAIVRGKRDTIKPGVAWAFANGLSIGFLVLPVAAGFFVLLAPLLAR